MSLFSEIPGVCESTTSPWRRACLQLLVLPLVMAGFAMGSAGAAEQDLLAIRAVPNHKVLTESRWGDVQRSSDRALAWLASRQRWDGSFDGPAIGQPGITGLCLMAFMSNGHLPGQGPYGDKLTRAIEFILRQQKVNGLISIPGEDGPIEPLPKSYHHESGVAGPYNHAIGALALSEAYGITGDAVDEPRMRAAIQKALNVALAQQGWSRPHRRDDGGWRYLHKHEASRADLSVTGWYLKFLRSAQNAGFNVPQKAIDSAVKYVLNCYKPGERNFAYETEPGTYTSRAMPAVGILALAHTSSHERVEALHAANFIARNRFTQYNGTHVVGPRRHHDRYHYSTFMCSMAMYQFGGEHWERFFPPLVDTLLTNQKPSGSWARESTRDTMYGNTYTTALMVLALSAPNQVLPIYQR